MPLNKETKPNQSEEYSRTKETWCYSDSSEKPPVNVGVKNSQIIKQIVLMYNYN